MSDYGPNPLDGSANAAVPSFDGQTNLPPSGDVFTTRRGDINAMPATGNGSLPPGAVETPDFNKRTKAVTTAKFIKEVAG